MKKLFKAVSLVLCFTLVSYFVLPLVPVFAADASTDVPAIDKSAYPNTVKVIKDARASATAGKYMYALALYKYADEVVNAEKEPILKHKIAVEKDNVQKIVDNQLEQQRIQKIKESISKALELFRADKLTEADASFKNLLVLDPENKEAKAYIEKIIPQRAEDIKAAHQMDLERQQIKAIKDMYIKARIYFKADELEESEKIYKQILDIDLDQAEAQNYVDVILPREYKLKPQRDLQRAERAKKRAAVEARIKKALAKEAEIQNTQDRRVSKKLAITALRKHQRDIYRHPIVLKDLNAAKVLVNDIKFTGNVVFDEKALKPIVLPNFGKQLSLEQLKIVSDQVAQFYHDGGYFLAQVVIPEQDIKAQNGVVNMTVLEGALGKVAVHGNKRISEKRVQQVLSKIQPGEPVRKQNIERGLLVLNSYSGVSSSSVFQPGKEIGSTDISVEIKEKKRVGGSLTIDNSGLSNTGKYHISPELDFLNITGRGDELNLKWMNALDDKHLYYGQVNYSVPLFSNGLQLKGYYARGSFAVGQEFASLGIESKTESWGAGVSYPLFLSQKTTMASELWYESKDFEQSLFNGAIKTIDDKVRKVRVEVMNFDTQDLKGRTIGSFGVHQGLGHNFGAMPKDSLRSSRSFAKADNDFTKITPTLLRAQSITDKLMLVARLSGQYSFQPLVAGEQWAIGGMNSVHGHESSVYLGDNGFTANLESRYTLFTTKRSKYDFLLFGDHGTVYLKHPALSQRTRRSISGAGVGLDAELYDALDVRVDWGFPIGPVTSDKSIFYFEVKYNF